MMRLLRQWVTILSALAVFGAALMIGGSAPAGAAPGMCFGMPATIFAVPGVPTVGTPGPDVIVGTPGPDNIAGKGGNDKICSKAGADVVSGGYGDDQINLGKGPDTATGDKGSDLIKGSKGTDTIQGGSGNDTIRGGGATDACKGGKGHSDSLHSCNETDPWLAGKRSKLFQPLGSLQTLVIANTGPGAYKVTLRASATRVDLCGVGNFPAVLRGTATGPGSVLNWDYTFTCKGGSTVAPFPVTGGRLTLKSDAKVLFELDSADFSDTYG